MQTRIQKWGNSLALRIPKAFAKESKINENELVDISLKENKIIIKPVKEKKYSLNKLVSQINESNLHKEIDFGKKSGNEYW